MPGPIPRENVIPTAEDQRRHGLHGLEQLGGARGGAFGFGWYGSGLHHAWPGEGEKMGGLIRIKPQGARKRLNDRIGSVLGLTLLEPGVVGDGDPGELGEFLAPQARYPAATVGRNAYVVGGEPIPSGTEKFSEVFGS